MNKKKGFTLIELLAVIVILAVIALIATPLILGVIEDAKIHSAEDGVYGYLDAVELAYALDLFSGKQSFPLEQKLNILEQPMNQIKVRGQKPTSGTVLFDAVGNVSKATLCMNGYVIDYHDSVARYNKDLNCESMNDKEAPVITIDIDSIEIMDSIKETDFEYLKGVTCLDNFNDCTVTYTHNIEFGKEGRYTITYQGIDHSGNATTKTRTVNILPTMYQVTISSHLLNKPITSEIKNHHDAQLNLNLINQYHDYVLTCDQGKTGVLNGNRLTITDITNNTNCELKFKLYLYKDGNEYTDITGGWERYGYNVGTFEKRSNYLYLMASGVQKNTNSCGTKNLISYLGYQTMKSKLMIDNAYFFSSKNEFYTWWSFINHTTKFGGVYGAFPENTNMRILNHEQNFKGKVMEWEFPISDNTKNAYTTFAYQKWYAFDNGSYNISIYQVWME